jgi:hypothetical protein
MLAPPRQAYGRRASLRPRPSGRARIEPGAAPFPFSTLPTKERRSTEGALRSRLQVDNPDKHVRATKGQLFPLRSADTDVINDEHRHRATIGVGIGAGIGVSQAMVPSWISIFRAISNASSRAIGVSEKGPASTNWSRAAQGGRLYAYNRLLCRERPAGATT